MLGFSTTDVVEMFTYYKEHGSIPADSDIDAIVNDMKPWYDNYCFAKQALKKKTRMFNCDMVLYYLRNYMDAGCPPEEMIDPNTRTDYGKMKKLLQFDKLDGERKGIIRKISNRASHWRWLSRRMNLITVWICPLTIQRSSNT